MKLSQLVEGIAIRDRRNWLDVDITDVATDSRAVKRGSCFVAVAGHAAD